MMIRQLATFILTAFLVSGCDESVPLKYSRRSEAEAEKIFARGWLPEIIPTSSRNITMRNDLDLNISKGEFSFDTSDHDAFVTQLKRAPIEDRDGSLAYTYKDWTFWINGGKNHSRFYMSLNQGKKPSEQVGAPNP